VIDGGGCYTPWQCFYFSAEYLLWFARGANAPPLATAGSPTAARPDALGQPGTLVLNDSRVLTDVRSGARFNMGVWLDDAKCIGIDTSFFFLGKTHEHFAATSTGDFELGRPLVLAVPFGGAPAGTEIAEATASNVMGRLSAGSINIDYKSQLWGYEANFRTNLLCWKDCYVDLLLGWRTLRLDESTTITEFITSREQADPGSFLIGDSFRTRNIFNGGQIGLVGEKRFWDVWSLDWKVKLALGNTHQTANISGTTVITGSANDGIFPVGILAQGNYLGGHSRDVFTVVPEAQIDLGYQISPHLRAFVGYNFLYWSSVARSSEQISRVVNPNLFAPPVAGATNPNPFSFSGSNYWAQGVNFGLEFRW
jgi:hypothetical protein